MPRLIITIIFLIAALVLGFTLVWPKYQEFQVLGAEISQKEAELDSKTAYYSQIKDIWTNLEEYQDVFTQIDTALPKEYSLPTLFNYLQQTAGQNGLILSKVALERVSTDKLKEIGINLEVSGSYSSFKNFLSTLEKSARLFEVRNIRFSAPSKIGEQFSFNLRIITHSY